MFKKDNKQITKKAENDFSYFSLPDEVALNRNLHRFSFVNLKFFLLLFFVSLGLFFGLTGLAGLTAAKKQETNFYANLDSLSKAIKDSNYQEVFNNIEKIQKQIDELNHLTQSYGQGLKIYPLLGLKKSKLTEKEILLNSGADLLNEGKKCENDLFSSLDINPSDQSIIDLDTVTKSFSGCLNSIQNEIISLSATLKSSGSNKWITAKLDNLVVDLRESQEFLNDLDWLIKPKSGTRDILLIFQNNSELRGGSGGSFGSFAIAKFKDGKLAKIDFGPNIYKLDNAYIKKKKITPPGELYAYENWTLKNAGYAVDGPEAFEKIRWFYKEETGKEVDGVISIDTTAFTKLLRITGPIEMPEYGYSIDENNFKSLVENEVQVAYFNRNDGKIENEPKKILGDMMPKMISKLSKLSEDKNKILEIFGAIKESLTLKNILFNFSDQKLQRHMERLNFAGEVESTFGDYLYVNNSNIGGAKSSLTINQEIKLKVSIGQTGNISNEISLSREHFGENKFPNGKDQNFVRILVPEKSTVKKFLPIAGNFECWGDRGLKNDSPYWIDREANKEAISFWMTTMPKEASGAVINYDSNYKIKADSDFTYQILFQQQPGAIASNLKLEINYPEGFLPSNVKKYDAISKKILLNIKLDSDKMVKVNFKKIRK